MIRSYSSKTGTTLKSRPDLETAGPAASHPEYYDGMISSDCHSRNDPSNSVADRECNHSGGVQGRLCFKPENENHKPTKQEEIMKTNITKSLMFRRTLPGIISFILALSMTWVSNAQISFIGLASDHEGGGGWNADGSGPEPAATGPQTPFGGIQYYYAATRDNIDTDPDAAGGHMTAIGEDFPLFEQALIDNGIAFENVKFKSNIYNMGDYSFGGTCFEIGDWYHSLYFDCEFIIEINGEPALTGVESYLDYYIHQSSSAWQVRTSYFIPQDVSGASSPEVQAAVAAFLEDLGDEELRYIVNNMTYAGQLITGNGRDGAFYDINESQLEKGKPHLPFNGWGTDHQGSIGWNADGTGPEPPGANSAGWYDYYASRDYDDIDPDPNAAYGSLELDIYGFLNFELQLAYRGYSPDQVRVKSGLSSLGDHIYGIDWEPGWTHYYGFEYYLELDGEPLIEGLYDTLHALNGSRGGYGTYELPKNASASSSGDVQIVAAALLDDLEDRYMSIEVGAQTPYTPILNLNGRSGYFFNVVDGKIVAGHGPGTFVRCDTLNSQFCTNIIWNEEGSPYYIDQDIVLDESMTLVILPGTKVAFRGPYSLWVEGVIRAEGTAEKPISFTRSNWEPKWNSLVYGSISPDVDSSVFRHCIFEYASALSSVITGYNSGAAVKILNYDKVLFDSCTFRENQVNFDGTLPPSGAAIALWNSSPHIRSCVFENNEARYGGAIISYSDSRPLVEFCLFKDNHARLYGGAIEVFEAGGIFKNNTIVYNTSVSNGAAFDLWDADSLILENNIIYNNRVSDSLINPIHFRSGPNNLYLSYNDIEGGIESFTGVVSITLNNMTITDDPMFCWPEDGIFNLAYESPCCNSGCPDPGYMGAYGPDCFVTVNEPAFQASADIYPNPSRSDNVTLKVGLKEASNVSIGIYNILGEIVSEIAGIEYGPGEHDIQISTRDLKPGTYLVRIQQGREYTVARLVKLR